MAVSVKLTRVKLDSKFTSENKDIAPTQAIQRTETCRKEMIVKTWENRFQEASYPHYKYL